MAKKKKKVSKDKKKTAEKHDTPDKKKTAEKHDTSDKKETVEENDTPDKKKKEKVKTKASGKKNVRLRDLENKPAWKSAKDANKLPKTGKADTFQNFAVAAAGVNKDLVIHKGKNGFSIHHPAHAGMLMGVGGSASTLRLTSEFFTPKDRGCKRDVQGYWTIVIENPTEDEVIHFAKQLVKRAKL